MKDKWLDELRDGLSDFEMDAPEGLWESLGVEKPMPKGNWRMKIPVAATILALLTVGSVFILWLSRVDSIDVDMTKTAAYRPFPDNAGSEPTHAFPVATGKPTVSAGKALPGTTLHSDAGNKESDSGHDEAVPITIAETSTVSTDTVSPEVGHESSDSNLRDFRNHDTGKGKKLYSGLSQDKGKYGSHGGRFAVAAYASGIGQTAESVGRIPGTNIWDDPANSNGPPSFEEPNGISITTETHHYQPLKAGVAFQYRLTDRVGLETGLMYTALATDITVSKGNSVSSGCRRMHYLGIPLNVKLSVLSWKSIDLYLSAGIMGEKCVSNRFQTKSEAEGLPLGQYSAQKEKPMQWSVNAAPGLQIKPLPNIGIFAEPGVSYYFNDGTSISTIYKDRPWLFNLNIGVRFNFHR